MNQRPGRCKLQRVLKLAAAGVAFLATAAPAWADDVRFDGDEPPMAIASAASGASVSLLGAQPLADDVLSGRRGGASTQNDMNLDGVVGSNVATNVVTGANTISSGAFAGTSGLPMVIQNSGNNVLIQNATIVNVQIK